MAPTNVRRQEGKVNGWSGVEREEVKTYFNNDGGRGVSPVPSRFVSYKNRQNGSKRQSK